MAAILTATFNAFAFAGAGFLFSKIDHGNYQSEMKRHNLAMEKFTQARDRWNQARLKELDRVDNLRYAKSEAKKDLEDTNMDLDEVKTKFDKTMPKLSDFYHPSPKMAGYVNGVKYVMAVPIIYGLLTLI